MFLGYFDRKSGRFGMFFVFFVCFCEIHVDFDGDLCITCGTFGTVLGPFGAY